MLIKNGAAMENSMVVLKELSTELAYKPAIPLLGIDAKELKSGMNISTSCS